MEILKRLSCDINLLFSVFGLETQYLFKINVNRPGCANISFRLHCICLLIPWSFQIQSKKTHVETSEQVKQSLLKESQSYFTCNATDTITPTGGISLTL